jgi:hypothetical protein
MVGNHVGVHVRALAQLRAWTTVQDNLLPQEQCRVFGGRGSSKSIGERPKYLDQEDCYVSTYLMDTRVVLFRLYKEKLRLGRVSEDEVPKKIIRDLQATTDSCGSIN